MCVAPKEPADSATRKVVQYIREASPFLTPIPAPSKIGVADWPALIAVADPHGLAPLLYHSLKQTKQLAGLPAETAQRLRNAYIRTGVANWLAYQELARWLAVCAREEIPVVLLKGCALATTLYPSASLRPMGDLDLLVPASAVARLRAWLTSDGYAPPPEMAQGFEQQFSGELMFQRAGMKPAQVDLHWHLFVATYYRQRTPIEWFWEHTRPIPINAQPARVLTPEAQLLHLCAHYALQHRTERVLWLHDIALLLAQTRDALNWDETLDAAQRFGLMLPMRATLAKLCDWWGVSIPQAALLCVQSYRPDRAERMSFAVTTAQRADARTLLDGLHTPGLRAKLRFWLRHLLPTVSYMRAHYRIENTILIPFYYVRRAVEGLYKVARSTIQAFKP